MNTVVIKSIDRAAIKKAVQAYAWELRRAHPEIERIIWFGSWVNGLPSPGSDVDLCLILSDSNLPRRERAAAYLPVGFPVGLDLIVYTRSEFAGLGQLSPAWEQEISCGIDI